MSQRVHPTWPCHSLDWKHNPAAQEHSLLGLAELWLSPRPREGKGETRTHIFTLHWPSTPSKCVICGRRTSVSYNDFCVKLVRVDSVLLCVCVLDEYGGKYKKWSSENHQVYQEEGVFVMNLNTHTLDSQGYPSVIQEHDTEIRGRLGKLGCGNLGIWEFAFGETILTWWYAFAAVLDSSSSDVLLKRKTQIYMVCMVFLHCIAGLEFTSTAVLWGLGNLVSCGITVN